MKDNETQLDTDVEILSPYIHSYSMASCHPPWNSPPHTPRVLLVLALVALAVPVIVVTLVQVELSEPIRTNNHRLAYMNGI